MEKRYLQTSEVSKMLKLAIKAIDPHAKVSVRVSNTEYRRMQEVKIIDVFLMNFNRIPVDTLNKIAKACRAHEGTDLLYGEPLRRFLLSGEIAYLDGAFLKVPWRDSQQQQLMMFDPEEVTLGCERVNLYLGRGTTGPFTHDSDFTWIKENFRLCENGYAERVIVTQ